MADVEASLTSYRRILEGQLRSALAELRRPARGLLLSSFSAGLDVSFSALLMAVVLTRLTGVFVPPVVETLVALMYSGGFVVVILGRSELFTEHTAVAVFPVLDRQTSVQRLLRLWALVYVGNLLGVSVAALMLSWIGPQLHIFSLASLRQMAQQTVMVSALVLFVSAVLAGWAMGLLAWLLASARESITQLVLIVMVTSGIGICHLHHCIVGSAEVLTAVFVGQATLAQYFWFLRWATLGNIVGGTVFVALLKYGHALHSGPEPEDVELHDSLVQQQPELLEETEKPSYS